VNEQPDPFIDYDAAYVMGALDPPDRRAFEAHLVTCHRCTAAVSELAGMPGLLAQLDTAQVLAPRAAPEPPPDTLLPRMALALKRERRRRRAWTGLVGTAAAACLITGIVLAAGTVNDAVGRNPGATNSAASASQGSTSSGTGSQGTALPMTRVMAVPVTASVRLDPVAWGTRVDLECTYLTDSSSSGSGDTDTTWEPRTYRLVVVPRDGGVVQQVAQWSALAGKTVKLTGSTDLKPAQIKDVRLLSSKGATLLHVSPS
jgi:hypothetical protein